MAGVRQWSVRVSVQHGSTDEPYRKSPGHGALHTDPRRAGHHCGGRRHHEPALKWANFKFYKCNIYIGYYICSILILSVSISYSMLARSFD